MVDSITKKSMPVSLDLDVFNFYRQENLMVSNIDAPINVVDISKTGIIFKSKSMLPIGYLFNANIKIGNDNTIHSVIQIMKSFLTLDGRTMYKCEFVGMATVMSLVLKEYAM